MPSDQIPPPDAGDGDETFQEIWARISDEMPPAYKAWLQASAPVSLQDSNGVVAVPDEFTRGRLEGRLRVMLEDLLAKTLGRQVRLVFDVDPETCRRLAPSTGGTTPPDDSSTDRHGDLSTNHRGTSHARPTVPPSAAPGFGQGPGKAETRLNPKYLFENFVIGASNRFAHAAAVAAAEAPGKAYNPLLIYGESGLGKTHLLHAIGHYVRSLYDEARVRYVSSEEFTNEFINAIRDDQAAVFQRRYRDVDVLLIDDIQFLEGKIQTQEEFFHTFNALHNADKQIVITSDRPPKRLEALEDRLRNRFEWGLITDVQPPDLETRIAILRKKAAIERLTAPPEVLEFIASKIQTNIRELEGALIRVTAFASLNHQPVDLTLTEIVLKDLIPEGGEPEITAPLIIAQTASYFGLSIDEVCGTKRTRNLVTARQIGMYLCRELTDLSLPQIGREFGGRDHSTVMHANKRILGEMAERHSTFNTVTELTNRIKQQARQR
jgi:chromosomal replication initiator protein